MREIERRHLASSTNGHSGLNSKKNLMSLAIGVRLGDESCWAPGLFRVVGDASNTDLSVTEARRTHVH